MKIETANIFKFYFAYEGTELMIPMAAATQEEAVNKISKFMQSWIVELNKTTAPSSSPTPSPAEFTKPEERAPDPMVLSMRIEEMVKELIPLKKPKGAQTIERLVKDWTGFPFEPQNYASIIAELGRLKIKE